MLDYADSSRSTSSTGAARSTRCATCSKQYQRNHNLFHVDDEEMPVFGTMASQFNDPGTNRLFRACHRTIWTNSRVDGRFADGRRLREQASRTTGHMIPPDRVRYLAEIAASGPRATIRRVGTQAQSAIAQRLFQLGAAAADAAARRCATAKAKIDWSLSPRTARSELDPECAGPARRLGRAASSVRADEHWLQGPRTSEIRVEPVHEVAVGTPHPEGRAAALRGLGRATVLAAPRERARASSRSRRACSRSSARARTRPACSRARAAPSAPTGASTTSRRAAGAAPVDGVRLGDALRRGSATSGPTSTARSATPACRSARLDDAKKLYSGFD